MRLLFLLSDLKGFGKVYCSLDIFKYFVDESVQTISKLCNSQEFDQIDLHHRKTDEQHSLPLFPIQRHDRKKCLQDRGV